MAWYRDVVEAERRLQYTTWLHHQMETFSALLALCEGNPLVTGGFLSQRPVMWSFDVFFELCLNKRLSKQSRNRWFETPSRSLCRHCNGYPSEIYLKLKSSENSSVRKLFPNRLEIFYRSWLLYCRALYKMSRRLGSWSGWYERKRVCRIWVLDVFSAPLTDGVITWNRFPHWWPFMWAPPATEGK